MISPALTESGMLDSAPPVAIVGASLVLFAVRRLYLHLFCIVYTHCQLIAVNAQLHRIAHRRVFRKRNRRSRNNTHIEKMLPQASIAADCCYYSTAADFHLIEFHLFLPFVLFPYMIPFTCDHVNR